MYVSKLSKILLQNGLIISYYFSLCCFLEKDKHINNCYSDVFKPELPRVVKLTPQCLENNLDYKVDKLHSTDDRESSEKSHGSTNS